MNFFGLFSDCINEILKGKDVNILNKICITEIVFEKCKVPVVSTLCFIF
jgi:hypothetical protein